jgi:alpha-tubulin suppressor-like RCC1 family protein
LGDGTTNDQFTPTAIVGTLRFEAMSAGTTHTCGLTIDGFLYCWGFGFFGHLGSGAFDDSPIPVRVVDP